MFLLQFWPVVNFGNILKENQEMCLRCDVDKFLHFILSGHLINARSSQIMGGLSKRKARATVIILCLFFNRSVENAGLTGTRNLTPSGPETV